MTLSQMGYRLARVRLRPFIIGEICGFGVGGTLSFALYLLAVRSPWMLAVTFVCAAHCVVLGAAWVLARHHAKPQSITLVCIGNWASALLLTFILPVLFPITLLAALQPVVLAQRYVRGRRLVIITAITAVWALALGALAQLQDASGISDRIPSSVVTLVIMIMLPSMAWRLLFIVWNNGAVLRHTTSAARRSVVALLASEQLLAEHATQLTASRARLISVADEERRRLERDLHDGAQQHLVALAILIQLARRADANHSEDLLIEAATLLETAIAEIRRLAHGIYPPLLISGGLAQALLAAAKHSAVPVDFDLRGLARYPDPIEAALYYCCTEALQNAAKHGGPGATVTITGRVDEQTLNLTISDTGRGFDPATTGTGLTNMTDRLAAIGGTLVIDTAPGCGTRIRASVAAAPLTGTSLDHAAQGFKALPLAA
jgi:signal transduction histidine kinase